MKLANERLSAREHSPGERLEGVEMLRFVLAFCVVVYHYYFFGPHTKLIPFAPLDGWGLGYLMFGVEAFFAVSGLVIVLSTARRTPVDFMIARMARLGPTLLVASTVTLLTYHLLDVDPRVPGSGIKYLVSITFFPLARLSGGLDPSLWSLSFEIRFYVLIFICMFWFNVRQHALPVATVMLAYDAIRLVLPVLLGRPFPASLDVLRDYAPFFALGILLYHRHVTRTTGPAFMTVASVALVLGCIRCAQLLERMNHLTLHLGPASFWQGILAETLIVSALLCSLGSVRSAWLARLFRVLGRASYPLYAVHQLCGYWMLNFSVQHLHLQFDVRPVVVAFMVGSSVTFGNWVEPRLIRLYRTTLQSAYTTAAALLPRRTLLALAREN